MCKCRSHGTFPLRLQSSHLNICYYHQDLHRRPLRRLAPLGFAATAAPPTHRGLALAPTAGYRSRASAPSIFGLVDSAVRRTICTPVSLRPPPEFLWLRPARHSSPSFGPDRRAPTRTLHRRSGSVGSAPVRDPTNQLPYALRVYSPVDSHTGQTPWSVFQDGSNGEPTGRRPEHADAEARREARAADHD
ncbi:hypothetical protein Bca4012_103627 [Brassica carinata]